MGDVVVGEVHALELEADAAALVPRHAGAEVEAQRVAGLPDQAAAHHRVLEAVGLLLAGDVVEVTLAVDVAPGELPVELVLDDGSAVGAFHQVLVTGPGTDADVTVRLVGGALGVDDDGAAGGVAAVDRPLGPLHHLHALEVKEFLAELDTAELQYAVDDRGHRGLAVAYLGQAADAEEAGADALRGREGDVGRQGDEVLHALDVGILQRLRGKRGHRVGRRLQCFLATPRGNDDLFEHDRFITGRTLGQGRRGQHRREGTDDEAALPVAALLVHDCCSPGSRSLGLVAGSLSGRRWHRCPAPEAWPPCFERWVKFLTMSMFFDML